MKKAIGITLSVIGIIMAAISLVFKVNEQISVTKSVSVIGGADGPTSIFVAGKIGGTPAITGIIVGIVLLAIGIFIFAGNFCLRLLTLTCASTFPRRLQA